jgi:hypothetical protein
LLHEGLIGVLGDLGLKEVRYETIDKQKTPYFSRQQCVAGASPTDIGRPHSCPTPMRI